MPDFDPNTAMVTLPGTGERVTIAEANRRGASVTLGTGVGNLNFPAGGAGGGSVPGGQPAGGQQANQAAQAQAAAQRRQTRPSTTLPSIPNLAGGGAGTGMSTISNALTQAFGPKPGGRVVSVSSNRQSNPLRNNPQVREALDRLLANSQSFDDEQRARFEAVQALAGQAREGALGANQQAFDLSGFLGQTARSDLSRQAERARAQSQQSLANRGLGNTTIVEQQQRAIAEDVGREGRAIDENIARQRIGILGQRSGLEQSLGRLQIDSLLSRRDENPLSQLLPLLQQIGAGGF